jgi:hypothetical protein
MKVQRFFVYAVCLVGITYYVACDEPHHAIASFKPHSASDLDLRVISLGADSYKERDKAETWLKKYGRHNFNYLKGLWRKTDDPEVKFRLERILNFHLTSTEGVPMTIQAVRQISWKKRKAEEEKYVAFSNKAEVILANEKSNSETSGPFAQQIVLPDGKLTAVELGLYPFSEQSGWMRLDVCGDNEGKPGVVLARSWIYVPPEHGYVGIARKHMMLFDLPDLEVTGGKTLWLVYLDFNQDGENTTLARYRWASKNPTHPTMLLWRYGYRTKPSPENIVFRVLKNCSGSNPAYRDVTTEETEALENLMANPQTLQRSPWMGPRSIKD